VSAAALGSKAGVDSLLSFSAKIGKDYSGLWVTPSSLRVTILQAPTSVTGTGVGALQVNVSATALLKAAVGVSAASTTSGALEAGSWGDVVQAITVAVQTSTQLYVTMTAPNLAAYPTLRTTYSVGSYVASWGKSSSATGLGVVAVNLTSPAATTSVTLSSLTTGVAVYVRVSVTVRVVAGTETLTCVGPSVSYPVGSGGAASVAPAAPILASAAVAGGRPMGTRGGDDIVLTGTALGLFSSDISATYSNGNITLSATNCRVTVAGSVVTCSSAVGVGAGFRWRIFVGKSNSTSPASSSLSYGLPIISAFAGAGASQAATQGGQLVNITGDQFGPIGAAYITRVQ
jgi:hypothetical protein